MKKKLPAIVALCFLVPVFLIGLFYIVLPAKSVSISEKRKLQQRPAFSIKALFDGTFTQELNDYYTDQLPGREFFIAADQGVNANLSTLFGLNKVQLVARPGGEQDLGEGENLGTDGKTIITFPTTDAGNVPEPKPTEEPVGTDKLPAGTDEEPLATPTPAPSEPNESTAVPTPVPTTSQSAEPTPAPSESKTEEKPIAQSGNILILSDRAVEIFYSNQTIIDSYLSVLSRVEASSGGAQIYNLLAPTASEFHAPSDYTRGSSNQKDVIAQVYAAMNPAIKTVDAYRQIAPHADKYLYFRTDHHWTQLGAYYAYTAFAETAGFKALALDAFTHGQIEGDFLGTLYGWAGQPASLKNNPDHVEYWMPPASAQGYAFTDATMSAGYAIELIKTSLNSANKYLAFTEGDHGLARFETSVKNGRSIMVIKESYGNAMVPFLASHYEYVYVFDPRKITLNLAEFADSQGIDDILVINYSIAIGNQGWKDSLLKSLN